MAALEDVGDEAADLVAELAVSFTKARDVTPAGGQPLHVLLGSVPILSPWTPSRARALVVFHNFPAERPLFYIDMAVLSAASQPPISSSVVLVLGESWRQFSFSFPWPSAPPTATRAVQLWLSRFRAAA